MPSLTLKKLKKSIINLFFPINCLGCNRLDYYICPHCASKIERFANKYCPFCFEYSAKGKTCILCKDNFHLDGLLALGYFNNPLIQKAIYCLKYNSSFLIARDLAQLLVNMPEIKELFKSKNRLLVPVPMHSSKKKVRGYNQTEVLVKSLSLLLKVPYVLDLIFKSKTTRPQMEIKSKKERKENILNTFSLNPRISPEELRHQNIILVDDVATTGATLNECASILKKIPVKNVMAVVIARQIYSR